MSDLRLKCTKFNVIDVPLDPLAAFKGAYKGSEKREREGMGRKEKGGEGRGGEGKGG